MSFVRYGVKIMRQTRTYWVIGALLTIVLAGCGKQDAGKSAASSGPEADRQQIQDDLTEVIARWHNGDRGALYENEFPYVRDRYTYDDYLKFREMSLDADTVTAMNVQDVTFFGRDSARVKVEVVFQGPTGKISKRLDNYRMFNSNGRWIRPTVGRVDLQRQWDSIRHVADSAAEAESKEAGGK